MGLRIVVLTAWADHIQRALALPAAVIGVPSMNDEDIVPLLGDADVLISARFSRAMGDAAGRLRLIHSTGAGTDQIDFRAVPAGARVCNVYGHEVGIAEYSFMVMLALNRDLIGRDQRLRQGDWGELAPQRELRGRTLAIVGLGHIGAEVARYARFFGMRVIGVTRSPDPARAAHLGLAFLGGQADLPAVLAEADFVVLAASLTPATAGLIGEREFRAMKPTAYLVNVSRGGVVDEMALYQALKNRTIAGAAIDVWYRYPAVRERCLPSSQPFHELDNIIMTPHQAGWTDGTAQYRWQAIAENVRRLAAGEPLLNVVFPAGASRG